MVLSEKTTFVWSISFIILAIGVISKDVIGLSTNQTTPDGSSVEETTKVEYELPGKLLDLNANTCTLSGQCENGGSCVFDDGGRHCQCRNGTSGAQCEIVDECVNNPKKCGIQQDVQCIYNIAKETAECKCNNSRKGFDSYKKICRLPCKTTKDCPKSAFCRKNLDNDLRFCNCPFGIGGDKCNEDIDECKAVGLDCGNNPNVTCEKNQTGNAVCYCHNWSDAFNYEVKDCVKCDCGGSNLGCHFLPGGQKKCYCYGDNYYEKDGKCEACDCGPNSKGCKFENGEKICDCEVRFRQENGVCTAWCSWDYTCKNGAKCVNEKCQCLPGTSGGFCEIIDECEGVKGPFMCGDPEKVLCQYDEKTQKPYCMCRIFDYIYYPKIRDCVECDCGKFGSCTLVDGKKTCKCNEGASLRKVRFWGDIVDRCDECDCGKNSNGCSFEGLYNKVCDCKKGFAQQPDLYGDKCNACSCGPHGECYFNGWYQKCKCDDGYKPLLNKDRTKLTCEACDCGEHGSCYYEDEVKKCNCPPGYTVKDGICTSV